MIGKNVLIVEDSPTEAGVMAKTMKNAGFMVNTVVTGEEAIEKAKKEHPYLILLDVILPGKNGFLVCRELKKSPETKDIKIIMVSTKGQESDLFWGIKQGADAYLPKPFSDEQLLSQVKRIMDA